MAKLIAGRNAKFARHLSLFVVACAFLALAAPHSADAKYASIVIDAGTGQVQHEANADDRNYPASLTKLMTLYLLFEAVENKRLTWNSHLTASKHASNQSPTHLALAPGEKISVHDATMALIIHSANDVAVVVAEELGGTEEKFALLMTAKARNLGMNRTTFRNASGLPHTGQQSTARDMAILAQAVIDRFPRYYPMFAETSFTFKNRVYKTHNRVTLNYPGADGLKTGFTHASGFNLITSATRNGRRLIGVVFGGNTSRSRDQQMEALLDEAFSAGHRGGPLIAQNTQPAPQKSKVKAAARQSGEGDTDAVSSVAPRANDKSDWGIQVGAFYDKKPAQTTAQDVSKKYAKLLNGGQISVLPLSNTKGRTLYRARIVRIDREAAYEACKQLKRAQQPCMELRGGDQDIAGR